ncbi:glycosyltransferase [Cereibacter sphaeroides]|uniref:glycosyltransferase n=1 Tax=Cereibacter sphaeroides TaxID=1063 RepID=UPI001F2EA1A6|nr:glycosyltransferase [Cereibacter sphaeroides]MCE6967483.1 glycosyltransferase [Cereibacter sphaeroides]
MSTAPLRILMLIPHLGVGGAQGAFLRLARFLAAHAQVTIAVMQGDAPDAAGLPVVRLDEVGGGKLRRWWRMLRRLRALKRQHDVAISFLSGVNLLNALTGPRGKTIVSERGSKRHDIGMTRLQRIVWTRLLDPLTYWRAGRVVTASEGLAHEIVTANRWAAPRVVAIEGMVEAKVLVDAADLPVEPDLMPLAECDTVVAFGRLHVQKGYDILLRAFARIRAGQPAARLLLIGDGPEAARLRSLAVDLGMRVGTKGAEADVILPGMRQNPLRYLRLGRVFALPSRYEGLPNALIEALAAGVPVLASDCPWGPRSILSAGALPCSAPKQILPLSLQHGVLMPVPDAPGATDIWVSELSRALQTSRHRPAREVRLRNVARYDIAQTGPAWLRLAEELARNGTGFRTVGVRGVWS